MADKKLNEVTKVTDMAYVPVIMADGSVGQIAKADLASVVAEQLKNNTWHPLEGLDSSLPGTFEELFKGLPDYTIITFGTMSGVEGGCVMFKHTINALSYGSFFNKFFGPCLIRRKPDETWEYQTTLGV